MNKTEFIKELENQTEYSFEQCSVINDVLENHYVFRKKNKPAAVAEIAQRLDLGEEAADAVFEKAMEIIRAEIKQAKRHPFRSRKD